MITKFLMKIAKSVFLGTYFKLVWKCRVLEATKISEIEIASLHGYKKQAQYKLKPNLGLSRKPVMTERSMSKHRNA